MTTTNKYKIVVTKQEFTLLKCALIMLEHNALKRKNSITHIDSMKLYSKLIGIEEDRVTERLRQEVSYE